MTYEEYLADHEARPATTRRSICHEIRSYGPGVTEEFQSTGWKVEDVPKGEPLTREQYGVMFEGKPWPPFTFTPERIAEAAKVGIRLGTHHVLRANPPNPDLEKKP